MTKKGLFAKLTAFVACIIICLSLAGCVIVSSTFKFCQPPENVVSMRIYYVDDAEHDLEPDEILEYEPICEIESNRYAEVMAKIESFTFKSAILLFAAAPSPSFGYRDYILYVEYADGGRSILDHRTRENFDSAGELIDANCYDMSDEFDALIKELAGATSEN